MRYTIARCSSCRWWPYFILDHEDPWSHGYTKHGEHYLRPEDLPALPPVEIAGARLHNFEQEKRSRVEPLQVRDKSAPPDLGVLGRIGKESG